MDIVKEIERYTSGSIALRVLSYWIHGETTVSRVPTIRLISTINITHIIGMDVFYGH